MQLWSSCGAVALHATVVAHVQVGAAARDVEAGQTRTLLRRLAFRGFEAAGVVVFQDAPCASPLRVVPAQSSQEGAFVHLRRHGAGPVPLVDVLPKHDLREMLEVL